MNIRDLEDKFKRAGGKEILRQYGREHVLGYALMQAAMQGTSQKSLEIVRLSVNNKVLGKLRRKYSGFIREYLKREKERGTEKKPGKGRTTYGSSGWTEWRMHHGSCRGAAAL